MADSLADSDESNITNRSSVIELVQQPSSSVNRDGDNEHTKELAAENAKKKKYKKMFILRILIRLTVISIMITLIITLKININDYLKWLLHEIDVVFGSTWSPIFFCLIFSVWTSLSPMGYLPTVLCGIFFKWYIAPFVAYISINIGSTINILLIRHVILKYKDKNCCIRKILKMCCGKKIGQVSFLKKLFIAGSPIKIIILLRLPYLNNGLLNYLFSLQIDSVSIKQNIIGNLVGFIPGSILFSVFGAEIKSVTKIISNGGFDTPLQMILFIVICTCTVVCYICIAVKVKLLIKKGAETSHRTVIVNANDHDDIDQDYH